MIIAVVSACWHRDRIFSNCNLKSDFAVREIRFFFGVVWEIRCFARLLKSDFATKIRFSIVNRISAAFKIGFHFQVKSDFTVLILISKL